MASRLPILALLAVFALVGCGKKNKRAEDDLVTDKPVPEFLASIPADSPFVAASLEPMPMAPMFQWAQLTDDVLGMASEEIEALLADEYVDSGTKAVFALVKEFKGKISHEGFESLGLSSSPRVAIYTLGPLPVFKMDLADPAKFEALLQRVEQSSGLKRTTEKLGEHTFSSYRLDPESLLVMTVQHRQVLLGVTPDAAAPRFVSHLVGESTPATSVRDEGRLKQIATKWGFEPFLVGYLDLVRIAQMFVDPQPGLNTEMVQAVAPERPEISEACKTEIMTLVGSAPRMVFGYEEFTPRVTTVAGIWEFENSLGSELAATKTPAPLSGAGLDEGALAALSLGFDVGKLVEVVRNRAVAIRDNPYRCEWFLPLNRAAGEVAMAATSFLPPIVTQIQGAGVVVTDVQQNKAPASSASPSVNPDDVPAFAVAPSFVVEGVAAIGTQDAVSLFDFLKSLVPEFASLAARPDGTPTALPAVPGMEALELPQVVLTPQLLIVTSGDGMAEDIARRATPASSSPFLSFSYDYKKLWELLDVNADLPPFGKLLGLATVELDPRPEGLFSRMTLRVEPDGAQ